MYKEDKDKEHVENIVEDTQPNAEETAEVIEDLVEKVKEAAGPLGEELEATVETVKDLAEGVADKVKSAAKDIKEDFKEEYLKVLAEMENLRKRFDKEKVDVLKYRASQFILTVLPTLDMFEMAMNTENASEEVKNWVKGFEMILNNFKSALQSEGVEEIKTNKGDEFDANVHHAIDEVETDEVEPGKIVEVKMKGYTLHDKLLRPATVIVAKAKVEEGEGE